MYGEEEVTEVQKKDFIKCKCGRKNEPNSDFCYKCGALLNQTKALKEGRIITTSKQIEEKVTKEVQKFFYPFYL